MSTESRVASLGSRDLADSISLGSILDHSIKNCGVKKVEQLRIILTRVLGSKALEAPIGDANKIRARMTEVLRSESTSAGTIEHFGQLFMGIVRRAAVAGKVAAPPEGPWTRSWQTVLDRASHMAGSKAVLRQLAAWASSRDLDPQQIEPDHLRSWMKDQAITDDSVLATAQGILASSLGSPSGSTLDGESHLLSRLLSKAQHGTVRAGAETLNPS